MIKESKEEIKEKGSEEGKEKEKGEDEIAIVSNNDISQAKERFQAEEKILKTELKLIEQER